VLDNALDKGPICPAFSGLFTACARDLLLYRARRTRDGLLYAFTFFHKVSPVANWIECSYLIRPVPA
jgi:hypothetical protein